nr:hypothetical protein [Tanacetum cinerariifolium]
MLHIFPRLSHQPFVEPPFEEEILAFFRFLRHSAVIRKLTDVEHKDTKKSNKMYYPRFTKVIIHHFMSNDPFILRRNKTHISQASGSGADEGTGSIPRVLDVPTDESEEVISWNSTDEEGDNDEGKDGDGDDGDDGDDGEEGDGHDDDKDDDGEEGNDDDDDNDDDQEDDGDADEEKGGDDEQASDEEEFIHPSLSTHTEEEPKDEESFDPISRTPKNRRGIQKTQEFEDSHVTLTSVNPDGQQQSSSVSSQFVTSMLNPTPDAGMKSIFETTSQIDVQTPTSVAPLPMSAPTITPSTIATITTTQQAPLPPTTAPSTFLQDLPNFGSLFRNLYKALVEAYESDKIILDTYGDTVMLKRRRDNDADRDEEPSAGSDRGSKRRREEKEPESASAPMEKATRSAGTDDQPIIQSSQHPEWFSQQQKPPTLDRDWNKTLPATHKSIQPWISELVKKSDSRSSFNELMDTLMDFSAFLMNRLRVDTLTPELLVGPTYKLMKGSCKSLRRIIAVTELRIVEWHNYKYLDWITIRRDDDKLKFKEGNFKRLRIQDIEDMRVEDLQLSVKRYQKKLNLTKPDTYHSDLKRKGAYIAYSDPRGFIYQNKDMKNRLMRIDELHKFSDGTLTDVRTALDDRLKGIRMQYLPQSIWRKSDKDRAASMIQAIDKRLKTRRIMRSLERFVGGRLYEGNFRMLQKTI